MDVHNRLGPGWDEWDYHRCIIQALETKGHSVVSHDRKDLMHRGKAVDRFELDLLVDDLIILELKHIKHGFHSTHYMQIINYLKRWDKRLGILINFGMEHLVHKRIPYDPVVGNVHGSGLWDELLRKDSSMCNRLADAVKGVLSEHGYGYGVQAFQHLLVGELEFLGAQAGHLILAPEYGDLKLERREMDCVVIDSRLLASVTATGRNASSTDLAYIKSYMKQAGIPCGVLIDIGNADILLKGVL